MTTAFSWICMIGAILSNAAANVLMKKASFGSYESQLSMYFSSTFIFGLLLFGINLLLYAQALRTLSLSTAYPVLVGGSLLIVGCISVFSLGEMPASRQLLGMLLVAVGIWLIA